MEEDPRLLYDAEELLGSPRHEYRAQNASIRIDVPEGCTFEYGEADAEALGRDLSLEYIRGRGNSTWVQEEKKAFKFKLDEAAGICWRWTRILSIRN